MNNIVNINRLLASLYEEYENIRQVKDDIEKTKQMDVFFIKHLKEIYECLNENAGVQVINIERFGRDNGSKLPMYVPVYTDKNGITKMSTTGYPYKATALMKLLFGFSSEIVSDKERLV